MNTTKFLHVIDNINFDKVDDNKNIKEMAEIAKQEINKIAKNENISVKEIMEDIDKFLSVGDEEEVEPPKEVKEAEKIVEEQEDLFDN
jgi:hypothetical protein